MAENLHNKFNNFEFNFTENDSLIETYLWYGLGRFYDQDLKTVFDNSAKLVVTYSIVSNAVISDEE